MNVFRNEAQIRIQLAAIFKSPWVCAQRNELRDDGSFVFMLWPDIIQSYNIGCYGVTDSTTRYPHSLDKVLHTGGNVLRRVGDIEIDAISIGH